MRTRMPARRLGELAGDVLVMGGDPDLPVLEPDGVHPLLSAVGRAFAEHRPLVLSPDAVWLTIASGIAQHIRLNAGELRPRLVSHPDSKRLMVTVDGPMPADPGSWAGIVEVFTKLLAAEIRDAGDFECDFSTSTDVERTAGRIVLMDAYSPYFSYWLVAVCGIPEITLTGTVEDWRKIRDRVDMIAGLGLENWCRSLAPITSQFVRAAGGDVDVYDTASGDTHAVALCAGLIGVTQDDDGSLRPVAGWHLAHAAAHIGEVIDRLIATQQVTPPEPRPRQRGPRLEGPEEVIALYDRISSATLCGGSWRLRPVAEHSAAWLSRSGHSLRIIADLPDGRSLAAATGVSTRVTHWIAARFAEDDSEKSPARMWARRVPLLDDPADVPVYGTSLAEILDAALDSGDIAHLESGRLSELAG